MQLHLFPFDGKEILHTQVGEESFPVRGTSF